MSKLLYDRFSLWNDVGMKITPGLGSCQSCIYYDAHEGSFIRLDTLHRNPQYKEHAFVTFVWACSSSGVRDTLKHPILFAPNATREVILEHLATRDAAVDEFITEFIKDSE